LSLYRLYRFLWFCSLVVIVGFVAMATIASGLLSASNRNYPGAEALDRLIKQHVPMDLVEHSTHLPLSPDFRPAFVHIDAAAAMSGVTR
jgi:hypothetical protein